MKFSTALSFLLVVPSVGGYNLNQPQRNVQTSLGYNSPKVHPSAEASMNLDLSALVPRVQIDNDAEREAFASSLGVTDDIVRNEYNKWLQRYGKVADESRYPQFKLNFFKQLEHDLREGRFYSLNEFGDCSKEEYTRRTGAHFVVSPGNDIQHAEAKPKIIVDEAKYNSIENLEERAMVILQDFGLLKSDSDWKPPAGTHSFTYLQAPEMLLEVENGSYLDALRSNELRGTGALITYLESLPGNENSVFAQGKRGSGGLSATASYLDSICDLIEPILQLEAQCEAGTEPAAAATAEPKTASNDVEWALKAKYAAIQALGEKAFNILKDLCNLGRCDNNPRPAFGF